MNIEFSLEDLKPKIRVRPEGILDTMEIPLSSSRLSHEICDQSTVLNDSEEWVNDT